MKRFVEYFTWARYHGSPELRWFYVLVFAMNVIDVFICVFGLVPFTWIFPFNAVFAVVYAYLSWPTVMGQAGDFKKADDDTTSNS